MMKKKHRLLKAILVLIVLGIVCYAGLIGFVWIQEVRVADSASELNGDYDAIIVLGAQVLPDGTPNVQLEWRLDAAYEAWEAHNVPVVVCGAQGKNEPLPEADAMKNYLTEKGVPADMILTDPDSFNTNQNLKNAAALLSDRPEVRKVLIVTSDYHVPRSMALARDLGFDACGLGSPCKKEYWLKNHGREALAWVKYWLVKYAGLNLD